MLKKLHEVYPSLYGKRYDEKAKDERFESLVKKHRELFGFDNPMIFSAAGRTELGGNHTDHQLGRVLAGSISLDTIAAVTPTDDNKAVLISEGFTPVEADLGRIAVPEGEKTSEALVLGIADAFLKRGLKIGGFRANTTTEVLRGSGLSSSAAIEVLVGEIFNSLYNGGKASPVVLAQMGQYAENVYYGKPCGLMDQTACAYGGIIGIDFLDPKEPVITPVDISFEDYGYSLLIVNTHGNHANLTPEYAAIPSEMSEIAACFGKEKLRGVTLEEFEDALPAIREEVKNDRAVVRAYHFIRENECVPKMVEALRKKDIDAYLKLVKESGDSSFKFLQNVYPSSLPAEQGLSVGLALAEMILKGEGAARVHGGGFAGTIQAYVPFAKVDEFITRMDTVFGAGSSEVIAIRPLKVSRIL